MVRAGEPHSPRQVCLAGCKFTRGGGVLGINPSGLPALPARARAASLWEEGKHAPGTPEAAS